MSVLCFDSKYALGAAVSAVVLAGWALAVPSLVVYTGNRIKEWHHDSRFEILFGESAAGRWVQPPWKRLSFASFGLSDHFFHSHTPVLFLLP
jgi:hypothetical protein